MQYTTEELLFAAAVERRAREIRLSETKPDGTALTALEASKIALEQIEMFAKLIRHHRNQQSA